MGGSNARIALGATGALTIGQGSEGAFAGSISGLIGSSFNKSGLATLHMSGASTAFSGTTEVQSGALSVSGSGSVLGTGAVDVSGGATLDIRGVNLGVTSLSLRGGGIGGSGALTGTYAARYDGTVTLADPGPVVLGAATASDTLTLTGALVGGATMSVVKRGLGVLDLGAGATYEGGTVIEAGTVIARHADALGAGAVTVSNGATLKITPLPLSPVGVTLRTARLTLNGLGVDGQGALQGEGTVGYDSTSAVAPFITLATASAIGAAPGSTLTLNDPVTGPGGLAKVGAGTVNLSGGNGYTGGTTIAAGTLRLANGATLPDVGALPDEGAVSLTGTGTLDLNNTHQRIGSLSGEPGTRILLGNTGSSGLTVTQSADGGFAGTLSGRGPATGTGALNKLGAGVLTLSGSNTFTGLTQVSEGVLRVAKSDALHTTSTLWVSDTGSFEIDGVALNALASLTLAGGRRGQETLAGRSAGAAYGGTVTLLGPARVGAAGASDTLTLSGQIVGLSDPVGQTDPTLAKVGAGMVTLAGSNTYAGGTTIEAGTLRLSNGATLPNLGAVSLTGTGILDLNSISQP